MSFTAILTLITTQGLCNITFSLYVFLPLCIWDRIFVYVSYLFPLFHIHVALLTLYRNRNQVYSSIGNCSTLKIIDGFLQRPQNLVTNLRRHPRFNPDTITQLQAVDTQVSSNHWGRGGLETGDYILGTFRAHMHLSHNVTGG